MENSEDNATNTSNTLYTDKPISFEESFSSISINEENKPITKQNKILDNKIIMDAVTLYHNLESGSENNFFTNFNDDEKIKYMLNSEVFLLNNRRIDRIANLEIYENLTELYLQRNNIKDLGGLNYVNKLIVLNLQDNYLRKIQNISHLKNLEILDLGDNLIESFDENELPENLVFVNFFDNLFYENLTVFDLRSRCIKKCFKLERIDKLDISDRERLILFDELNLKGKKFNAIKKSLRHIQIHYENMKNERTKLIEEWEKLNKTDNLKTNEVIIPLNSDLSDDRNIKEEEKIKNELPPIPESMFTFITEKFPPLSESLKIKSQERRKCARQDHHDEMKSLKEKLNEAQKKLDKSAIVDQKKREEIQEKINKAMKYEEKMLMAEEKFKEITQKFRADQGMGLGKNINFPKLDDISKSSISSSRLSSKGGDSLKKDLIGKSNIEPVLLSKTHIHITSNNTVIPEMENDFTDDKDDDNKTQLNDKKEIEFNNDNSLLTDISDISLINNYRKNKK
jgi:hypothetical protein